MVGYTISHYKIISKLGEGGMGVVYKAEDTKLKRPVALKFLKTHLLGDEEVKARFRREAEAAASLHHPNICTVYEIDEVEGKTFIAMAFIEGEGLDKKIDAAPLKINEVLEIAIQIAQGLRSGHENGVTHRDIKPANVIVGSDGHATIMDFGLALLAGRSKLTKMDTMMGTVAYMSPEQAEGAEVDHRTDIWALGTVIYEALTGQRAFQGHYEQAIVYSITNEEPEPLTALRTGVPMELEWIVGKALAKDAGERYQSADELIVDLTTLQKKLGSRRSTIARTQAMAVRQVTSAEPPTAGETRVRRAGRVQREETATAQAATPVTARERMWIAVTLLAFAAVGALWFSRPERPATQVTWFVLKTAGEPWDPAVSPDGRRIAYVLSPPDGTLWVQDLDRDEPREIEGTEGAVRPFWSPDSTFIAFFVANELRKVAAVGGLATLLCKGPQLFANSGTWSSDSQTIVFSGDQDATLWQVPSRGGESKALPMPAPAEEGARSLFPHFLPLDDGKHALLYTEVNRGGTVSRLMLLNLATRESRVLGSGAYPAYSPSGHIIYRTSYREFGLWALPFSLATLEAAGEAFPLSRNTGDPSVARNGTLVFRDEMRGGARAARLARPQRPTSRRDRAAERGHALSGNLSRRHARGGARRGKQQRGHLGA